MASITGHFCLGTVVSGRPITKPNRRVKSE
jgi:hypothetical protein